MKISARIKIRILKASVMTPPVSYSSEKLGALKNGTVFAKKIGYGSFCKQKTDRILNRKLLKKMRFHPAFQSCNERKNKIASCQRKTRAGLLRIG